MAPVTETKVVARTEAVPASDNQPAKLIVKLPADAKLYVDSYLTKTGSQATRVFTTPVLAAGQDYAYTLKAELERDGKTITTSKRVVVRAGAEVEARLDMPEAGAATASR
jgi:uncharacterized protein (TIGR03000 family)